MRPAVYLAGVSAAIILCALSSREPDPPRPPIPDVAAQLDVARIDLLAARVMADAEIHAQATAYVIAKAQRRARRGVR